MASSITRRFAVRLLVSAVFSIRLHCSNVTRICRSMVLGMGLHGSWFCPAERKLRRGPAWIRCAASLISPSEARQIVPAWRRSEKAPSGRGRIGAYCGARAHWPHARSVGRFQRSPGCAGPGPWETKGLKTGGCCRRGPPSAPNGRTFRGTKSLRTGTNLHDPATLAVWKVVNKKGTSTGSAFTVGKRHFLTLCPHCPVRHRSR